MRRLLLIMVAVCSCGCSATATASPRPTVSQAASSPSPTALTPQPSPTPTHSAVLAIVVGLDHTLRLVSPDGAVIASTPTSPATFGANSLMSWTSASLTRVYYLNGGSEVRFLEPSGATGTATRIPLGSYEQAGFSVSPDDKRIAIAIFSYTQPPASSQGPAYPTYKGMRMYVEDLNGGTHHVQIFSSATIAEFPIGWTGGNLVISVTYPQCCQDLRLNPYDANSYHVADPATGKRLASLCDNSDGPEGPVEPIGTICAHLRGAPTFQRWDGSPFPTPAAVPSPDYLVALSPDGTQVAVGGDSIRIMEGSSYLLDVGGYVFGWLDPTHVVYQALTGSLACYDLVSRKSTALGDRWGYLGTFPAAIS